MQGFLWENEGLSLGLSSLPNCPPTFGHGGCWGLEQAP